MKTLIIIKEEKCSWLRDVIPNIHPGMMPLCNKPLLEYLIDFAILCGSSQVRLILDGPDDSIEDYFEGGNRWGVGLSYSPARVGDELETILKKNSGFIENSPLLVIDGFFFIHHNKNDNYGPLFASENRGPELSCPKGSVLYLEAGASPRPLKSTDELIPTLQSLDSIQDFHTISMEILARDAGHYVLPGYNNEEAVFIGRNVAISKTTAINKPVLLGNNVQLQNNSEIGPGAVIGSNVIVDSGTRIENSIVLDNTYVGAELTIKDKIVRTNMAISADTGTVVHFVDDHLLSGIKRTRGINIARSVIHWCLAFIFYLTALIPALIMKVLLQVRDKWHQHDDTILKSNGDPLTIQRSEIDETSLTGKVARALAVDKVMFLPLVLSGKLDLVGNKPFHATAEGVSLYEDFDNYLPGVFYFSEAENIAPGDFQEEITERYFSANRSLVGDLRVIFKTLINRW